MWLPPLVGCSTVDLAERFATLRCCPATGLMDLQAVADAEEEAVYRALLNRPRG